MPENITRPVDANELLKQAVYCRKEERRFTEMQDSGSAKIIPVEVKFREKRSRIGIFEYLKEAIKKWKK